MFSDLPKSVFRSTKKCFQITNFVGGTGAGYKINHIPPPRGSGPACIAYVRREGMQLIQYVEVVLIAECHGFGGNHGGLGPVS